MTTTLEVAGIPAEFCPELMAVYVNLVPVESGATVSICSWCDPKKILNQSLYLAGYKVSHGICEACRNELLTPQPTKKKTT